MNHRLDVTKINSPIKSAEVVTEQEIKEIVVPKEVMHESFTRPEILQGSTYKIKHPNSEHAMYVTINDVVLNAGTTNEERRPLEIFINSKNMDEYQWILALTRVLSACFRKGGDVTFLPFELMEVFDPKGGHFYKGRMVPSVVARIGIVLKEHMATIGLIKDELDEHQKAFILEKKSEHAAMNKESVSGGVNKSLEGETCLKCFEPSVIIQGGCKTCTSCGESSCQ